MREIFPSFVVFAHGPPLAFAQVRSPLFPKDLMCHVVGKSFVFGSFFTHVHLHLLFSALIITTRVLPVPPRQRIAQNIALRPLPPQPSGEQPLDEWRESRPVIGIR